MEFDDISTFDADIAEQGVWKEYVLSGKKISFLCHYVDPNTQAGMLKFKRTRAPYAKEFRTNEFGENESAALILAHVSISDWKGITSKGKAVEFTPDLAFDFFRRETTRWLTVDLIKYVLSPENFAAEIEEDFEEVTKN